MNQLREDTGSRDAVISPCGKFRYYLEERFPGFPWSGPGVCFVMLNPSTADASKDDPTIRKCRGFAKKWFYSWFRVVNLFAYRATDPRDLKEAGYPIGPENDKWVAHGVTTDMGWSPCVVIAWGNKGQESGMDQWMLQYLRLLEVQVRCLGVTSRDAPCHPLMLPYETKREEF